MSPPKSDKDRKESKDRVETLPEPPRINEFNGPPTNGLKADSPQDIFPLPLSPELILNRLPLPELPHHQTSTMNHNFLVSNNISGEILEELRKTDFGSFLQSVPKESGPRFSPDELTRIKYKKAQEAYLSAGKKHLELGFFKNATLHFSSAILCVFLSESVFEAAHLAADLAPKLPPSILNNNTLQGVKLLLKGTLLNNMELIDNSESWLFSLNEYMYAEDKSLFQNALQHAKQLIQRKKKIKI